MKMLMTGVGNVPTTPSPFIPTIVPGSCETMELQWGRSEGRGFNVHKYRVFRRTVEAVGAGAGYAGPKAQGRWSLPTAGSQLSLPMGGGAGGHEAGNHGHGQSSTRNVPQRVNDWILIYDGIEEVRK